MHPTKPDLSCLPHTSASAPNSSRPPLVVPDIPNRSKPFPLTEIQQAYWLGRGTAFALGGVSTHLYWELRCPRLDLARLEAAWQAVVERHGMLRAIVLPEGQQQILAEVPSYKIAALDLRDRPAAAGAEAMAAVRDELSHQVVTSDRWPLFEIRATRLPAGDYLHLSFDGLTVDFQSVFSLLQAWGRRYQDSAVQMPPLSLSFRDYVLADRASRKQGTAYQKSLAYWLERLDTLPPAPAIPLQKAPQQIEQTVFVRREVRLDASHWQQFRERAADSGLTPSGAILAAYAEILTAWSKNPRFCLNLTLLNRQPYHPQVAEIVGDFTSLLLLEVDNSHGDESFLERAKRLQRQFRRDLRYRQVDGTTLLREFARHRDTDTVSMPVVFTSLLGRAFADMTASVETLGRITYGITQTPQVWLDCQVMERQGILYVSWDAVEELFPAGMLDDMLAAFGKLLVDLAVGDGAWHDRQPRDWLPVAQRQQREKANATAAPLAPPTGEPLLQEMVFERARQQPEATAVIATDGQISYRALAAWSYRIGRGLQQQGVGPGDLVAIVAAKSTAQIAGVLGILAAGAAYVPIDPDWPTARQWELLARSQVRIVLTQESLRDRLAWPEDVACYCPDAPEDWEALDAAPLAAVQAPTDLAYVIYTSGSTGKPKGVAVSHQSAANTLLDINRRFAVGPQDRLLGLAALSFDLSVYDIFGLLAAGGTLVLPGACQLKEPSRWHDLLVEHHITLWNSVPALMQMLVERLETGNEPAEPLPLRLALLSGDWLPLSLPERLRAYGGEGVRVVSLGGATEAAVWSIFHPIDAIEPHWKSIPYGKPLANQQFYVLDGDLADRPDWVPGQLYIGGMGLAREYWGDGEKTAASFIKHPQTGERLYRTGDLGRFWPDGTIEFLGREDNQVKINGFRVEIGEVEARLSQHPGIREAVATLTVAPGGNKQLVAFLVPAAPDAPGSLWQSRTPPDPQASGRHWQQALAGGLDAARILPSADTEAISRLHESLDGLHRDATCCALRQLGFFRQPGERHGIEALLGEIVPRYSCWLHRSLQVLVGAGWLQADGDGYFRAVAGLPDIELDLDAPRQWSEQIWGLSAAESQVLVSAAVDLADILAERTHSGELYAREATPSLYQKLFAQNHAIAQAVLGAIGAAARPERILEVGAGYGSLTQHLLPVLAQGPTSPEYWFTDISSFFEQRARAQFADYPAMHYAKVNFDCDPALQGVPRHSFDVVIAASALHVACDLEATLEYLQSLLVPGGILLLIEETQFFPWFDLLMGLQQGFENFRDRKLRPEHPLLSRQGWARALERAGFSECACPSQPGSLSHALGFDVLIARGPTQIREIDPQPLHQFLQHHLPAYMVPARYVPLNKLPLSGNGKVDRQALATAALPVAQSPAAPSQSQPPQTPTERALAQIWADILQIEAIDRNAHFFALGGDSLLAARAIARIQETCGVEIPFSTFFQAPTPGDLAAQIEARQDAAARPDKAYEEIEL